MQIYKRLKLLDEEWEVALACISIPTFGAVKRSIVYKFPGATKVGFKSGLLAYEEKDQPADTSTNPTKLAVVYGCLEWGGARQGRVLLRAKFGHSIAYQTEFSTTDRNPTTSGHRQERLQPEMERPQW